MSSSSAPGHAATSPDAAEQRRLLIEWNATEMPYPREACLHELFEQQVDRTPQRVALEFQRERLTYDALNRRANQLAQALLERGVQPGSLIAIALPRSLDMVAGVLAILKAGCAYVPLDPDYPPDRIRLMLEDSSARIVLAEAHFADELPESYRSRLICPARECESIARQSDQNPQVAVTSDALAYVIYTSGSTGRPKGVQIEHRNAVNYLHSMRRAPGLTADDVLLAVSTISFDIHVLELYLPLVTGAEVLLVDRETAADGRRLVEALSDGRATIMQATPATWRMLIETGWQGRDNLRVISTGEALSRNLADELLARSPEVWNAYGPTETTVHSSVYRLTPGETGAVLIGRPVDNTQLYILDPKRNVVPLGAEGELYIGGDGVARGYLNRPDLTAERFVPDPFSDDPQRRLYRTGDRVRYRPDGNVEYLGRLDHQVKIRGFRIELGEIETALLKHAGISQCVVVAREDDEDDKQLVAYVVPHAMPGPTATELRTALRRALPDYMIPAAFVMLDALPLTPNGKVDRKALPAPDRSRDTLEQEYVAPRDALERFLAETWQEVLKHDRVGIADNFFDLGGDSIRAASVINRLQRKLEEFLYVVALFDAPTIADYAAFLKQRHPASVERAFGLKLATDGQAAASHGTVDEAELKAFRQLIALRESEIEPPRSTGKIPPVVFILCAPRSGSTLLRVMLAGNPGLFSPPELELLGYETLQQRKRILTGRHSHWLEGTVRAIMELKQCDADEAKRIMADYEDRGLTTQDFYRELQQWVDGRMIVDKSTTYAIHRETLERAERIFEGAYYLFLTRHPGGMVKSFESVNIDQIFLRYEHNYPARELGELVWHTCNKNIVDFLTDVPPERQFHLRYEDLVEQPEGMMRSISDLLGLEFHPDMVTPYRDKEKKMTDGLHSVSIMLGDMKFHTHQGIDPNLATRWKEAPIDLGRPTWELAEHLGYDPPAGSLAATTTRDGAPLEPSSASDNGDVKSRIAALERELAELKRREEAAATPPATSAPAGLVRVPRDGDFELSFMQQRMWVMHQFDPQARAYNRVLAIRITGPVDEDALRRAVDALAERHEVLRTVFVDAAENDEVRQRVLPPQPVSWRRSDLERTPPDQRERVLHDEVQREIDRPFQLATVPPFRSTLLRFDEQSHVLLLAIHHIISDGRTDVILTRELAGLYQQFHSGTPASLPDLPFQYVDFAVWQRRTMAGDRLAAELKYWDGVLAGAPKTLELPSDRPRASQQTFRGARRTINLPADVAGDVAKLAQQERGTPFMALFAAFNVLLNRYTRQSDLLVDISTDCRNQAELEAVAGFFSNRLVVRAKVDLQSTFRDLLRQVRQSMLGSLAHNQVPFELLVERHVNQRDLSRNPLVQVAFVPRFADSGLPIAAGETTWQSLDVDFGISRFDLTVFVRYRPTGVDVTAAYKTDLFDEETIDRLLAAYRQVLTESLADPDCSLSQLDLLPESERRRLITEWNQAADFQGATGLCLHQFVEEQVRRTPDAIAIQFEQESLSFAELDRRAEQLAHYLRGVGVGPDRLVAVAVERSPDLIVAMLGTLKAGGAYVPIEVPAPSQRVALILEDSAAQVVLTQSHVADQLPPTSARVVRMDADWPQIEAAPPVAQPTSVQPENLAYVIYTSGSTGRPKGVMIPHRAIVQHMKWVLQTFPPVEGDAMLQKTPAGADASVREIFLPLVGGGRLVLARPGGQRDPAYLIDLIQRERVTILHVVPAQLKMLIDTPGFEQCRSLRRVHSGGEALPVEVCRQFYSRLPVPLFNMYGPTEVTINATYWPCPRDMGTNGMVIGRPLEGVSAYILDENLQLVPQGVPGELCLGGGQLARGYLNRPELTCDRFVPDPFAEVPGQKLYRTGDLVRYRNDGNIEFLGRLDHQVKLRGFRIEPGEIEAIILRHPNVAHCIVVAWEAPGEDKQLVAYFVPRSQPGPTDAELRQSLRESLPDYMVPGVFVSLDALPLLANGKVDRKSLPEPDVATTTSGPYVAPSTPTEKVLAELWSKVLKRPRVGANDDFFDLGGDSLQAVRLFTLIEQRIGKRPPVAALFEARTVQELARVVDRIENQAPSTVIPVRAAGHKRPFFCVSSLGVLLFQPLADRLEGRPFYGCQAPGYDGEQTPPTDVPAIAARHLRGVREVQPHGPYLLGGQCMGGLVAYEMAQQLIAEGEEVSLVVMIDCFVPREPTFVTQLLRPSRLGRRTLTHLEAFQLRSTTGKIAYLGRLARLFCSRLAGKLKGSRKPRRKPSRFESQVRQANLAAIFKYRPQPYPGRILQILQEELPVVSPRDRRAKWQELARGGVEFIQMPGGDHLDMFRPPYVEFLAEQLEQRLDAIE